jgi:hypothetical protein
MHSSAAVDFENHEASFEDVTVNVEAQGSPENVIPGQDTRRSTAGATWQRVPYDLLVGADGEAHRVRSTLPRARSGKNFQESKRVQKPIKIQ